RKQARRPETVAEPSQELGLAHLPPEQNRQRAARPPRPSVGSSSAVVTAQIPSKGRRLGHTLSVTFGGQIRFAVRRPSAARKPGGREKRRLWCAPEVSNLKHRVPEAPPPGSSN